MPPFFLAVSEKIPKQSGFFVPAIVRKAYSLHIQQKTEYGRDVNLVT